MVAAISTAGGLIETPLDSEDCRKTLEAVASLGARVSASPGMVRIGGGGKLMSPLAPIECGNSGTTMRLLAGLLAGANVRAQLRGDASLSKRPMRRVAEPLRQMGAVVDGDTAPLFIEPAPLHGIDYLSPVASAQVKSAILLAGLFADSPTSVTEPSMSRDHTERMLAAAGCEVARDHLTARITPNMPNRVTMRVPADISSAAYFMVAALLVGGPVHCLQVGVNPTRTGILDVLTEIGARFEATPVGMEQGEPVADIVIEGGVPMKPFSIGPEMVPRLIDELPALAVLATQCEGRSVVTGAGELRVKESDRIQALADGLGKMGANIEIFDEGFAIEGPSPLRGAKIAANRDHRIGMAFAVAGLIADGATTVAESETIATSFPGFEEELRRLSDI
jgi:3-phosphoshikimate 1-carboxyvinyltransferase